MLFELQHAPMPDGYGEALLPLVECKAHLDVEEDDWDDLIEMLRDAAIEAVEWYTELKLGPHDSVIWRAEGVPSDPAIGLVMGVGPVQAINALTWRDSDNEEVTGVAADYRIVGGKLRPIVGGSWGSNVAGAVELDLEVGFPDGECPKALLQAARMLLAHFFANREAVITGTISGEIPFGVRVLCSPFLRVTI